MAQKKITIKDVAKEAGVSVATVSYVMNHRTDIKISDDTRKKVLQVANLLNYTPNLAAKALATSQQHLLGITYEKTDFPLMKAQQMMMLETFLAFFRTKGYEVILIDAGAAEQYDQVDALICYGVTEEHFHALGDKNFVPLIAFDCDVSDNLFFQINNDCNRLAMDAQRAFGSRDYTYLLLQPENAKLRSAIEQAFPNHQYYRPGEEVIRPDTRYFITDPILDCLFGEHPNVFYASTLCNSKLELLFEALDCAINRRKTDNHNLLV